MFKNVRLFGAGTKLPTKSTMYTVGGSADSDDIARWVDVLTTLLNMAEKKELDVSQHRQRLFGLALAIFAAVIAFSVRSDAGPFRSLASVALFALMIIFAAIDRHFHRCVHGWRRTERERMDALMALANKSGEPASIHWYCVAGETTAERWSLQPVITYLLVFGSVANVVLTFWDRLSRLL
jgi:hypothetical protein